MSDVLQRPGQLVNDEIELSHTKLANEHQIEHALDLEDVTPINSEVSKVIESEREKAVQETEPIKYQHTDYQAEETEITQEPLSNKIETPEIKSNLDRSPLEQRISKEVEKPSINVFEIPKVQAVTFKSKTSSESISKETTLGSKVAETARTYKTEVARHEAPRTSHINRAMPVINTQRQADQKSAQQNKEMATPLIKTEPVVRSAQVISPLLKKESAPKQDKAINIKIDAQKPIQTAERPVLNIIEPKQQEIKEQNIPPVSPRVEELRRSIEQERQKVRSNDQDAVQDNLLDKNVELEHQTQLLAEREPKAQEAITLEQAMKLDLSLAKIGTTQRQSKLSFRGHSIGSGTYLDRLITAIADFIKRLEMRFFSLLDRLLLKRRAQKVKLVLPADEDGLHQASFSSALSKQRRRKRGVLSWFSKLYEFLSSAKTS